ncbi:apolipoprotein N-acyltransferase [Branchiibius hedensis]|uniref:Apolipoprotein N-acyltransferase n=1 Tax=Branchiibius hedensis TaxID=672460 RepID=A0A2Y8ZUG2_9MICO|nr:apolipoprotein N-acyltransferase [Branchiibius hedensis]PWJ25124.1 apolipoprotein N-acyltransferase [Branchiibius hedensis]SSA33939.1 apolipoprotein N-acyltransferase [Branchiibius hedensis]
MLRRLLLAAASGVALWAAFPTINWWWLAPIAVAGLALATCGVRARVGLLLGFSSGLTMFVPGLAWSGTYVGQLPWFALAITESVYLAAMGGLLAWLQGPPGSARVRPVVVALLWVVQEWVRGTVPFGGFPWLQLAWSQADSPLLPIARFAGSTGLTFAVALIGGLLAAVVRDRRTPRLAVAAAAGALALALAPLAVTVPVAGQPLQVMGIQGNVPTAGLDFNAQRRAVLDNHVRLTQTAAEQVASGQLPQPQLVVWPENSSDIDPLRNADAATEILQTVAAIKAPLIVGAVLQQPSPKVSNASLLYLPDKGLTQTYIKRHPVPFAEYVPYRSFFRFFSKQVDLVRADFVAGDQVGLFQVPTTSGVVPVTPIICFEVAYDGLVRSGVDAGAQLIAVQTNNATFGYSAESAQQLAISRVRAVEFGRSVIHVSTVGISALITPDGRTHQRTQLFTPAILDGTLPLRTETTPADRIGAAPVWLAVAGTVAAGVLRWRRRAVIARPAEPGIVDDRPETADTQSAIDELDRKT